MIARATIRTIAAAVLLFLAGCGGLYFGDNPGPDVRKERGPLTVPPRLAPDGLIR